MSNGARQRSQGRRAGGANTGLYVRGGRARGGQPVAGQRRGDGGADEAVLPGDAAGETPPGGGAARGAGRDVEEAAMAVAGLLGRVRAPGRMEMNRDRRDQPGEGALFTRAAGARAGPHKDWELTPEAFSKLLAELSPDSEVAGAKYEELRGQLIKFFEWRGSFFPDQHADETLNRVARKIDEGERIEKSVTAFALGVARFVLLEALRDADSRRVKMDELTGLAAPADDPASDDRWLDCLKECL